MATTSEPIQRVRINDVECRGLGVGAHASTLWISAPLVALGVWVTAMGFGVVATPSGEQPSAPVVAPIGLLLLMSGLWLAGATWFGLRRTVRARRLRVEQPGAPWLSDYPWDEHGVGDDRPYRLASSLLGLTFLTLFLSPFLYLAFLSGERMPWFVRCFIGLFGLTLLLPVRGLLRHSTAWLRFGRTRLRFRSFPLRPDGEVDVVFEPNRLNGLNVTLRFVEEWVETRQVGGKRTSKRVADALYIDRFEVPCSAADPEVVIRRPLPNQETWTNQLSDLPVRYWELVVEAGDDDGRSFRTSYLLPVYAEGSPGSATAATRRSHDGHTYAEVR